MPSLPNTKISLIMGVLNCTPDSFSDGGAYPTKTDAVDRARAMIDEGADMIDVGGESTRPGSEPVAEAEQIRRTVPVIAGIRRVWDGPISIDTTRAAVAREAIAAGATWINDISALRDDPQMIAAATETGAGMILMHMKGVPRTMQKAPIYDDVVAEVSSFLKDRASWVEAQGVPKERIVFDPGIGFGKTIAHNLTLLANLTRLIATGYPVLIGASRKSFIGRITGTDVDDRLEGSLAAAIWASLQGARIIRVHDVQATRRALNVIGAITETRIEPINIQ
jgi:dihydropteroate synthase